jgi:hypothetical protein
MTPNRSSDELVIVTKVVVSWIQQSEFPITDKLVFRNNIFRELLAINRQEAEMRQVGRDTDLTPFSVPAAMRVRLAILAPS